MPKHSLGVDVLGTLALAAPRLEEFQFVKFTLEGEVARLTLNRPEHNLLNERMLAELAAGISTLGERRDIKLLVLDSAAKVFLRRDRAGRIHAAARLSNAGRVSRRVFRDAGYIEAASGSRERPGLRRRRGTGGTWRSGDRDTQGAVRAAGNQARSFSAARRGDSSVPARPEARSRTGADGGNDICGTRARTGAGELARARK